MEHDGNVDIGAWIRQEREQRGWSKAELARRIGVTPPAIGHFENKTKRPRKDLLDKLRATFGAKEDSGDVYLGEVEHVSEALTRPSPERIRIGVSGTWDAALFTAYEPLLLANDVVCEFDILPGWGADPLEDLVDGRYDALIHNRFLLASAEKNYNVIVRMVAPLYSYRGQFVFVRRKYVEQVRERSNLTPTQADLLDSYLADRPDIFAPTLKFPKIINISPNDSKVRSLLLGGARFAYIPGTDLEEALRQLYDETIEEAESDWLARSVNDTCRQEIVSSKPGGALDTLFKAFREEEKYDIFCGGLAHLWKLGQEQEANPTSDSIYMPICDPRELSTPSLNGLIALDDTIRDRRDTLERIAVSFYAGARLFKSWYQSIRPKDKSVEPVRSGLHLANLFRFANEAKPLGEEYQIATEDPYWAWAWARLMIRYIDFFGSPREANVAATDLDARRYAENVSVLSERARGNR